jgi:tetratricopeptide (TPR) repeat protein
LGNALLAKDRASEAIPYFEKALVLQPDDAEAHNNLADALRRSGRLDEAIAQFRKVLELRSRHGDAKEGEAHDNLGNALLEQNRIDEAIDHYRHAVDLQPDSLNFHNNLGNALLKRGLEAEAVVQYEKALVIDPTSVAVRGNLAWVFAASSDAALRHGSRAVELARQANDLSGGRDPIILNALAAAYAETGQFPQAVSIAQQALNLIASQGNTDLSKMLRREISLYRAGLPYHEPSR